MNAGFKNALLQVETEDGRNFDLTSPLVFEDTAGNIYRMPVGATTDGGSTPRGIWSIIPPFGQPFLAFVLHDGAYRNALQKLTSGTWVNGTWEIANLEKVACDDLLLQGMRWLGVSTIEIDTIIDALAKFGTAAFDADRSGKPIMNTPT